MEAKQPDSIMVIKKSGKKEPLQISKIKKQIQFTCLNNDIDPLEFERKIHLQFVNNMSTEDVQNIITATAINNVSDSEPDWVKVAGRAAMWNMYGNIYKTTGFKIEDLKKHIKYLCNKGYYKQDVYDKWIKFGLKTKDLNLGTNHEISENNTDFNMVISSVLSIKQKYIIKNKLGNIIEYPIMIDIANALLLASSKKMFFRLFKAFSQGDISLATPFLRNLRRPYGNTGSCFIGATPDSLAGIIKMIADIAFISKAGGGVGWYVGKIRPGGSVSETIKKANFITKWTKIINDLAVAVDQEGVRKAGITLGYDWWQLDIDLFLDMKSEISGDLRDKAFDIFPQILLDNYFIDAVEQNKDVYLFNHWQYKNITGIDPTDLIDEDMYKVHEDVARMIEEDPNSIQHVKINAKDFWNKRILWTWIEVGEIFIAHKDMLNISNYLKNDKENPYITYCGNLCLESFSINKVPTHWKEEINGSTRQTTETDGIYHGCNLLSINLANMIEATEDDIKEISELAVYIMDQSIEIGNNPVLEATKGLSLLRNVGIGFIGKADYMAYHKKLYDTLDGRKFGTAIIERFSYNIYKASIELAKKYGPYPLFKPENYTQLFGKDPKVLNHISKTFTGNNYDWVELLEDIKVNGIRNFYLLALAPNTSTGVKMGVSSSFLPVYNKMNYETLMSFNTPVVPKFLKDRYWYYKTRLQYKPEKIVEYTGAIQTFVDTGISMELNMEIDLTEMDKLSNELIRQFKLKKIKAVYYNTSVSGCTDCSN